MPKFKIVETVTEERWVEGDDAQHALENWLENGDEAVVEGPYVGVDERYVEDEDGNVCETEEP